MKKYDVIVGNPTVARLHNGKYHVVYAQPPLWTIQVFENLTIDEVIRLPFMDKALLKYLKTE